MKKPGVESRESGVGEVLDSLQFDTFVSTLDGLSLNSRGGFDGGSLAFGLFPTTPDSPERPKGATRP